MPRCARLHRVAALAAAWLMAASAGALPANARAGGTLDTRALVAGGAAILGAGALGTYYDSTIRFDVSGRAVPTASFGFGSWGADFPYTNQPRSALSLDWAGPQVLGPVRPLVGAIATSGGSAYAFGGLQLDVYVGEHLVLSPVTGMGHYTIGHRGLDLNHPLQFRSGLTIAWRLPDAARIGVGVHHLSNAGLALPNPGSDMVTLRLSVPLKRDGVG